MDLMKPLWLSQKRTSFDESQIEQRKYSTPLLDLFRVNVYNSSTSYFDWSPTENEKKRLFLGKKFTKNNLFDLARAKQTLTLVRELPFLYFALEPLYLHYDLWQGTSATNFILSLQAKLDQLHANFFALIDAVEEFKTKELKELKSLLAFPCEFKKNDNCMQFLEPSPKFKMTSPAITNANQLADDLTPYFWQNTLENGTKECFVTILQKYTKNQPSYEEPAKPNILGGVPGIARLQLALREAKAQAASERVLRPLVLNLEESANPSLNKIYALKNRQNNIVAYLKNSKAFGAKTLEKLAWDLACIFGVQASFNPTTTTTVHYYQNGFGDKFHLGWRIGHYHPQYFQYTPQASLPGLLTLVPFDLLDRGINGSFQPTLQGSELAQYLIKSSTLKTTKDHLIRATLVTILFGMMDAHAKNVFVQDKSKNEDEWKIEEGSLIFFDNPRIFPNGDVILTEDFLLTSYRSGLLELEDSYTPLNDNEQNLIKEQIRNFEQNIPLMEEHLNRKSYGKGKSIEEVLPAYWFDTKKVIQNTKDRLKRVKEAFDQSTCLRDLVFASNPDFKWVAALHIAAFNPLENKATDLLAIQKISLPNVGGCSIQKVLNECENKGIDPTAIKKACEDTTLSFDKLLENLFRQGAYVKRDYLKAKEDKKARELKKFEKDKKTKEDSKIEKEKKTEEKKTEDDKKIEQEMKVEEDKKIEEFKLLIKQALNIFIEKAVPDFKDRDITSLTISPERLAVLTKMTLLQFKNLGFPTVEIKQSETNTTKYDEDAMKAYIEILRDRQHEQAEIFFQKNTNNYVISPPGDYYRDTKFTLFYKDLDKGTEIFSAQIDFTSSPGNINLDHYAIPTLTLYEFKKFCDDLPISLRYRKKDNSAISTQCWVVELDPTKTNPYPTYASVVLVDD